MEFLYQVDSGLYQLDLEIEQQQHLTSSPALATAVMQLHRRLST